MTWNVNSVRLRLDQFPRLLEKVCVDIICLQEIKTQNDFFPYAYFTSLGFLYHWVCGMKGYNGVAILSKYPLTSCKLWSWCGRDDARHISVHLGKNWQIHTIYVPAGGDIPDPNLNPKFAHKLAFLTSLQDFFSQNQMGNQIVLGDFNVAPLEKDVWSHQQLKKVVSHTDIEIDHLNAWQESGGFMDAIRHFVPASQPLYSWWSYRAKDWRASNRGRRLDHIWVSKHLSHRLLSYQILDQFRDEPTASDHVPVIVTLQMDDQDGFMRSNHDKI
jgi:exodeoxyribonuclease-3